MKKFFKILLLVVLVAVVGLTGYYLYANSQEKPKEYAHVSPAHNDIRRTAVLTGTIEPRDEIEIKPQISGIIEAILVEAGQNVKAGDIIARIKVIPEASQLSSAQARVDAAKVALTDATDKYNRNDLLYGKKIISREEYETSATTLAQARVELQAAQDALDIVREGVSKYNSDQSNTLVRATIDGLILDVPVKVGSSVIQANTMNDGTTVATIANMSNLIFKGNVDETEVGQLAVGMPMDISIGALPGVSPRGEIEYIAPKGTDTNGAKTFELKAAIIYDGDHQLRAGYSANASVILSSAEHVLSVPEGIIEFSGDSTFVYVFTDTTHTDVRRVAVETGLSDGINIEVKSGIDSTAVLRGDEIREATKRPF